MNIFGLEIGMPVFWLIVAVVFLVIEGITMGLTTIWFSGGSLVALVSSLLGAGVVLQIVLFFIVSIILLLLTRKIFVKKLHTGLEKTNVDALVGAEAVVVSKIEPFKPGRVKIKGQEWSAIADDDQAILQENQKVKVMRIEGVKAIVKPIQ